MSGKQPKIDPTETDVIFSRIGDFGKWQGWISFWLSLFGLFAAWHILAATFLAPSVDHWCRPPDELADIPTNSWKDKGLPREIRIGEEVHSQCKEYNVSSQVIQSWIDNVTEIPVDQSMKECDAWDYDNTQFPGTTIQEWQLICDRAYLADFIAATYMVGFLIGVFVFGHLSDIVGRKRTIILGSIINIVFGIASAFSPNVGALMALRFFVAMSGAGIFTTGFVLIMEFTGGKWRTITGLLLEFPFTFGFMSLPLLAWLVPRWSEMILAMHIPTICYLIILFFLPESPRWLLNKHRIEEAENILERITKFNKIELTGQKLVPESEPHPFVSVFDLFRLPRVRLMTLNMWYNWFTNSFVYYGLSLSGGSLVSNVYLNIVLGGLVEIPAYILAIFLLLHKGRRLPLCLFEVVGGVCLLVIAVVPRQTFAFDWPIVVLAMVGKFCITASFGIIYIYSAELFPTVVRNIGVGSSSTCARVGGIVASFMKLLGRNTHQVVPVLLFGVSAVAAGTLALRFPETNNRKLPETLQEAEDFLEDKKHPLAISLEQSNIQSTVTLDTIVDK